MYIKIKRTSKKNIETYNFSNFLLEKTISNFQCGNLSQHCEKPFIQTILNISNKKTCESVTIYLRHTIALKLFDRFI